MYSNDFKTKYAKVSITTDFDGDKQIIWACVRFAWGDKADPTAKLFGDTMDQRILDKLRKDFAPMLKVNPEIDIYLEDVDILINGFSIENKHLAVHLVRYVKEAEAEFDTMMGAA